MDKTVIVAGVGCRRDAPAADIEAAIRGALARAGVQANALSAVATIARKEREPGIAAAAAKLELTVVAVTDEKLAAVRDRIETHSDRVLALTGVPSVAEAAALAAAGPSARLICPRLVFGMATCALAAAVRQAQ